MNDKYILEKLIKWVPLFYGKQNLVPFADVTELKNGKKLYSFGYITKDNKFISVYTNSVTEPVAIFLALGNTEFMKFLEKEGINPNLLKVKEPVKRCRTK